MEWEPDSIRWYIDGNLIYATTNGIPHKPHYLILNTAIGGSWPGNPDSTTIFPQYHDIDYVRIFQKKPVPPAIETKGVTEISTNTAVSGGDITNEGGAPLASKGVCWNTSVDPVIEDNKTIETGGSASFISIISQLSPKTTYYIRAYATNVAGTGYGKSVSFTTLGDKPGSNGENTSGIQLYSATLNGSVNPNSLSTTVTFEWGTTTDYGNTIASAQSPITGNIPVNVTADLFGLTPGTTYHFRIKAENSLGITYSNDMTFKTLGDAPSATILNANNIRVRSSVINGSVNPNYLSSTAIFEWGTTTSYGNTVTAIQSPVTGNTPVNISADLSGLLPGTTYYVRIKAENSIGTTYSSSISFATAEMEWVKSSDFPGEARSNPLSFTYNGKGYFGLGRNSINQSVENLKDFWTFDPATSAWTRLNDCPFTFITGLSSKCLVGSILYVFKEYSLYSYDINLDSWQFICNTGGISLFSESCFSIDNKAFFFNKSNSELYEYVPQDKIFSKKSAIISGYLNWGLSETFVINNEAYLLHKNDTKVEVYHYISQSATWEKKIEKTFSNQAFTSASFIVTIDNSVFIGQSTSFTLSSLDDNATVTTQAPSSNVWKYDCLKNEFIQGVSLPGDFRAQSGCFSFNNTGYVISGVTVDSNTQMFRYLKDTWIMNR